MKKLLSIIVAMVLAASFFTGCVDGDNSESNTEPTPTPTVSPSAKPVVEDEEDPNYPTVLAMWKDMDGYWTDEDGDYLFFTLDENGKAVLYSYDDGKLDGFMKATAVMSSNKTSYYIAVDLPAVSGDEKLPGLMQKESAKSFMIELGGYGDGYVELAEDDGEMDYEIFVKVGENLDNLKDAMKQAEKLEKDD